MSVTYASQRAMTSKALSTANQPFAPIRTTGTTPTAWTRPADWITMPSLTSGVDKKIYIIAAIFNNASNQFALKFTGTGLGVYVDWGDGAGPISYTYTAGTVTANYNIAWANVSSGTLTSRGYRQALVTVTLQGSGLITAFSCDVVNNIYSSQGNTGKPVNSWIDMSICMSDITTLNIGSSSALAYASLLERVNLVQTGQLTTGNSMFLNCEALQNIPTSPTFANACSDASAMFQGCSSLQQAPDINMPNATGGINMFYNCFSLIDPGSFANLGTTQTGTQDFGQMFYNCYALVRVPALPYNGAKSQSFTSTFFNCLSLESVPPINVSGVSSLMTSMFQGCSNLRTIQLLGTPAGASVNGGNMFTSCFRLVNLTLPGSMAGFSTVAGMFNLCYALETLPDLDFSASNNFGSLFTNCYNLRKVGTIKCGASLTTINLIFSGCYNLTSFGGFTGTTNGITNASSAFTSCVSLKSVPDMTFGNLTTMANMFQNCYSLRTAPNITMSAGVNTLSTTASMFQNCYSLLTVPSYANWNWTTTSTTVQSMFQSCSALKTAPSIGSNSSRIITYTSMFNTCSSLISVPAYAMTSATTLNNMFQNCLSLTSAPAFTSTTAVTAAGTMFSGCVSLIELPAYNFTGISSGTNITNFVASCPSISRSQISNIRFTHSYASARLSGTELDEIYTNLPTITAQTITVSQNWGVTTDNPTIATAKGWTVTGT